MRFLEYIWASIVYDTVWVMGNTHMQLIAWAIGIIAPIALTTGLMFGLNRTILVLSMIATLCSALAIGCWLVEMDFWMHAPPPLECNSEACDNDGTIRTLFAAGALLLPVFIPSLLAGPIACFGACRRLSKHARLLKLDARRSR